jgi:hypothetical protein
MAAEKLYRGDDRQMQRSCGSWCFCGSCARLKLVQQSAFPSEDEIFDHDPALHATTKQDRRNPLFAFWFSLCCA